MNYEIEQNVSGVWLRWTVRSFDTYADARAFVLAAMVGATSDNLGDMWRIV